MLETPVVFIIFNRPDTTRQVFAQIARVQPQTLFVIADGPRSTHPSDIELTKETRKIIDQIDWPCDVHKNYSDMNLGAGVRVATGLEWVFGIVERAIILEDDCFPSPTFFTYCTALLDRYESHENITEISGTNFLNTWKPNSTSYLFSLYGATWGWATWRRSWQLFDFELKKWLDPESQSRMQNIINNDLHYRYWSRMFSKIATGDHNGDIWDYQWSFASMNHGLTIVPSRNLIRNIGFGPDATHTFSSNRPVFKLKLHHMEFPLRHPAEIRLDRKFDERAFKQVWGYKPNRLTRLTKKLLKVLKND